MYVEMVGAAKGGEWANVRGGHRRDKTPVTAFKARP